ncbi:MAG: tRNA (N(6)-L-threonylcarbamoyladenosine(37)-C(2))-methylthiotransferase MtaB [Lachnospiraceae bacterium]|nr:tRNA (N(6)-L-threonylcarbamoyladenosine(37)-C(2))-methylthiotransferase MtaB [Lachnospiraceae bacterium]
MKKVAFHNLGCKVNAYEMELMQQNFRENGFDIVPFGERADIYIINTCTVTNIADRKSRQMLHKAKSLNKDAIVVAAGCYVETDRERALKDESIDIIVGNKDKKDILNIIWNYIREREDSGKEGECPYSVYETVSSLTDHTRAYIKVQDGCDQYCSYCIIPFSRGHVISRNEEETLKEIRELAEDGCREFVITGIHLSSYGLDMPYNTVAKDGSYHNEALTVLIEKAALIPGVRRIRLGSLEPRIITCEFLARMRALDCFCPHFHLSLQSGSNEVLKRMNRRYDVEEYEQKTELIRKYFDHPAITTDIIVGFPGETEEEFKETRDYLNRIDFYEAHIFAYSRRKGTVADGMKDQLTRNQKSERSAFLLKDSAIRKKRFMEYYMGRKETILVEETVEIDGRPYLVGYNKEYVKCGFCKEGDTGSSGSFMEGTVKGFINDDMLLLV